jgi:hypothetical protein
MPIKVIIVFGNAAVSRAFGDGEITTRDADIRGKVFLAQGSASDHRQFFRIARGGAAQFTLEQFTDVIARKMHCWKNNVIWRFFAKLHDEFAQIGLDDFVTVLLQRVVQVNLLGGHGLGLDDGTGVFSFDDA